MGFPINGISYLLNSWDYLKQRSPHAFYLFLLFTREHREFAGFFEKNFEKLDRDSGHEIMFFAIAPPPPGWREQAAGREYWQHYMANSMENLGYDKAAVYQAARHFDIPADDLPAIALFRELQEPDLVTARLGHLKTRGLVRFFHRLFDLLKSDGAQYAGLQLLRGQIEALPDKPNELSYRTNPEDARSIRETRIYDNVSPRLEIQHARRSRASAATQAQVYYTAHPSSIFDVLAGLQAEVALMRREQQRGFQGVNRRLDTIQQTLRTIISDIANYRSNYLARSVSLELTSGSAAKEAKAKTQLREEFDTFLETQAQRLADELRQSLKPRLPSALIPYHELLEDDSRAALQTAEMLWRHLDTNNVDATIDYAICGIGLWKAVESEINRTFVDALRVYHRLAKPGTSSLDQLVKEPVNKTSEDGIFKGRKSPVLINPIRSGKMGGLELGSVAGLLGYAEHNSLGRLARKSSLPLPPAYSSPYDFLAALGQQINQVAQLYRNGYAHLQPMKRETCEQFRSFVLEDQPPHSPLLATLRCRAALLQASLI